MNTLAPEEATLHVIGCAGGGMERYVRDLVNCPRFPGRHLLLRVCAAFELIEGLSDGSIAVVNARLEGLWDRTMLHRVLGNYRIGRVHMHLVDARTLDLGLALADLSVPYLVTLHDFQVVEPNLFAESGSVPAADWEPRVAAILRRAGAVIAPSAFMQRTVAERFGLRDCMLIPHAPLAQVDRLDPDSARLVAELKQEAWQDRAGPCIALVGAIGPHKGEQLLNEITALDGAGSVRWVVVGYTGSCLVPHADPRRGLIVHGAFEPEQTRALLDTYGADVVLLPSRVPEAFGYALSDVWASGRLALVPDLGALGERMREGGGGEVYDPAATPGEVLARVKALAAAAADKPAPALRQEQDRNGMCRDTAGLYRAVPVAALPCTPPLRAAELDLYLRSHIDDVAFRSELRKLARDNRQLVRSLDELAQENREAEQWMARCEGEVAKLKADNARLAEEAEAARNWGRKLEADLTGLRGWAGKLETDSAALREWASKLERDNRELAEGNALAWQRIAELEQVKARLDRLEARVPRWLVERLSAERPFR